MRSSVDAGLNNLRAERGEWTNRVTDDFALGKEVAECSNLMFNLNDLVFNGVNTRNRGQCLLNECSVAPCGYEGDAKFA